MNELESVYGQSPLRSAGLSFASTLPEPNLRVQHHTDPSPSLFPSLFPSLSGVHHEKLKKQTGTVEVHTETAKEIVKIVLAKLDTNGDGVLTMREFVAGGVGGLPNFKGVEHLGHHYDAEGEYFLQSV